MSKKIFITGGTGSIGMALVKEFAQNDCQVTFQYSRNENRATEMQKEFGCTGWKIDFSKMQELREADFDVIINNAAINISSDLTIDTSIDDWNRTLLVNVTYQFLIVKQYLPTMQKKGWGRILNISSIFGLRGIENNLPYTVSKHALSGLTKTVAKEVGDSGVTCNEICPGPVTSELMTRIAEENERSSGQSIDDYFGELSEEIPLRRLANPAEIASLALYLASDGAGYINGVSIPIDGGLIS